MPYFWTAETSAQTNIQTMKTTAFAACVLCLLFTACASKKINHCGALYPPDVRFNISGEAGPAHSSIALTAGKKCLKNDDSIRSFVPVTLISGGGNHPSTGSSPLAPTSRIPVLAIQKFNKPKQVKTPRTDWDQILFTLSVILGLLCFLILCLSTVMLLLSPFSITMAGLIWYQWLGLIGLSAGGFLLFATIAEKLW